MKVLLDECVPHSLRLQLVGHEVFTATYMRWDGIKNGLLLQLASSCGFEALVTTDRSMAYQHDEKTLRIPIFSCTRPAMTLQMSSGSYLKCSTRCIRTVQSRDSFILDLESTAHPRSPCNSANRSPVGATLVFIISTNASNR